MLEITKAEFMDQLLDKKIEWPPVILDGKIYGFRVSTETTPDEFVWAPI